MNHSFPRFLLFTLEAPLLPLPLSTLLQFGDGLPAAVKLRLRRPQISLQPPGPSSFISIQIFDPFRHRNLFRFPILLMVRGGSLIPRSKDRRTVCPCQARAFGSVPGLGSTASLERYSIADTLQCLLLKSRGQLHVSAQTPWHTFT